MGKVVALVRIMPVSVDVDMKRLEADLRKKLPSIQDVGVEPIAFGLKALKVAVIVNDEEGGTDAVEKALAEVPGVSQAETVCVNRMI
jgi:elongation factor 1-beta